MTDRHPKVAFRCQAVSVPSRERREARHLLIAQRGGGRYGMRFRAELIGVRLSIRPNAMGAPVVRCVLSDGVRRERHRTGELK